MPPTNTSTPLKPRFVQTQHLLLGCFDCFIKDPTIINSDALKNAMIRYERIFLEAHNAGIRVVIDDEL